LLAAATTHYWRVSAAGTCGPATVSSTFAFTTIDAVCSTPDQAIPDNSIGGITNTMLVDGTGFIGGVRVWVDVRHPRVGDLVVSLGEGLDNVVLLDRPGVPATPNGCLRADIDAGFDSEATTPVESMCQPQPPAISGVVQPQESIDMAFAGHALAGTWRLNV